MPSVRPFIEFVTVGFGLVAVVAYVLNWPSRRFFVDAEFLPMNDFQQKYPKKYWIGKTYPVFISVCMILLFLLYAFILVPFLLDIDMLPFIITSDVELT